MSDPAPIKVCCIAPKAYPLFNPQCRAHFGGAPVDLYYLATELAKDNQFQVSFIVADYGQDAVEEHENVAVFASLDHQKNFISGASRVCKALARADADIYLMQTSSAGTALIAWFCQRHRKIFTYRSANTEECDGTFIGDNFFLGRAFSWALRRAQAIFVQNADDRANLRQSLGLSSTFIRNGSRIPPLAQTTRDTILWVGRSWDVKRPDLFLDLAAQVPDQHFTIICQEATQDKHYDSLVARAATIDNLQFLPYVPFHEVQSYFQRAHVLVNTSRFEGYPNTFVQACKAGTPILSLNVNPDDFLHQYQCGFCARGNWDSFVTDLKRLLDPTTFGTYSTNARRYAEENHDIAKIIEQYKGIFRKLVTDA